jgi:OmcA/MtrC family decaheme c-type cytochrome
MEQQMTRATKMWGAMVLAAAALVGCGGGNDGGSSLPAPPTPPPVSGALGAKLTAAAAVPANDTATNSSSAFKVLQDNGVPAVVVAGPPKVNFTVFSDGVIKSDVKLADVSFAVAKLVPGANGEIDQWVSYVNRTEVATPGVGPGGTPVLASAKQATTDPKPASQANQLVFNAEGYYTYTFSTNITDPAKTMGVTFEPNRTHRIAIQLSYVNAAGETVRVNPYFDVTFDGNGRSVQVTDPNKTRVMSDVSSCNGCHDRLALHGGGRVDVQYCVMCHNPGTTDANSGNVLTMQTMTHKIHAGRLLSSQLATGGENYVIWGFRDTKHDYSEVGFPQDLRNCTVCHTAANPKTPQGDNWKSRASKESCLTCHANKPGSDWHASHTEIASLLRPPVANPQDIPNSQCADCHAQGATYGPDRVHWNQNEENAAKYKVTIESALYDPATRKVSLRYFVSDPTRSNAKYNLVTPDCTFPAPNVCTPPTGTNNTQFGNLRFYVAYQNVVGQPVSVTEFSSYNNGGSGANALLYRGTNDGSNTYAVDITLPADTATAVAAGSARIVGVGQVKEVKLEVAWPTDPRPPVSPTEYVSVVVQHGFRDFAISGALNARREIVSNDKCNVCHGALGTTSGSNTLANAFHGGARNTVEACALCHDQNRYSSTVMTNGRALSENYSFKRMIHGIHGNSKRQYPFTHGNNVIGAFDKNTFLLTMDGLIAASTSSTVSAPAGTLFQPFSTGVVVPAGTRLGASGSEVQNYAAEVAYPSVGLNCNGCHVNDSWKRDFGTLGSVVAKPIDRTTLKAGTNPLDWVVITPKAASCTSCHDSEKAISHVVGVGGSAFGTATQAQSFQTLESCVDCHAAGRPLGVDVVHK